MMDVRAQQSMKMKVGIVGCGNIAADLCIALQKGTIPAEIVALTDVVPERAKVLLRSFHLDADIVDLDENAARVDFLIECAVGDAVKDVLEAAVRHQTDCLIMSVGGLMFNPDAYRQAAKSGIQVRLPSGAVCGLDGIRAAMETGLHRVVLTTRKPPKGLAGAPYLVQKGINLDDLDEPKLVFSGSARDAVKNFPQNVNVAAAISFAGIGPDQTEVRIIADPEATQNIHEVVAEGAFGKLTTTTENMPSPRNPKSSYMASLSAIAELRAAANAFTAQMSAPSGPALAE
jgi:aspartate dehydrogenase